jgi:hypothetical protein
MRVRGEEGGVCAEHYPIARVDYSQVQNAMRKRSA